MLRVVSKLVFLLTFGLALGFAQSWVGSILGDGDKQVASIGHERNGPSAMLADRSIKSLPLKTGLASSRQSFLNVAFKAPRKNKCEVLSPDQAYVEEMLIRFGEDGGKSYERRVALVVGNSDYSFFDELKNPGNDATSMTRVFRALGFAVYRGIDLSAKELETCLKGYYQDLENNNADIALFYYAGHGVQLTNEADNEKRNYMLATDADIESDGNAKGFKQIDTVLTTMRSYAAQNIFFYDACRSSPVGENAVKTVDGQSVRVTIYAGAAAIDVEESQQSSQSGIYIAYASAPNKPADDAYEKNANHSPFTRALLNHIATPGYSLKQTMSYVSNDVGELTDWEQTPWTSSSLTEELKLNGRLNDMEVKWASMDFANQARGFRESGYKAKAIVAALKSVPAFWSDDDTSEHFTIARRELYLTNDSTKIVLPGDGYYVTSAAFSPDGSRIVTGSWDNTARIWDAGIGVELMEFVGHLLPVSTADFSSDGARIVTGS